MRIRTLEILRLSGNHRDLDFTQRLSIRFEVCLRKDLINVFVPVPLFPECFPLAKCSFHRYLRLNNVTHSCKGLLLRTMGKIQQTGENSHRAYCLLWKILMKTVVYGCNNFLKYFLFLLYERRLHIFLSFV